MKRNFTLLMAAFALMVSMMMPLGMRGQTRATLFSETFNSCDGTGGNDGSWSGSIASSNIHTDNTGWSFTKEYGADKCAKFGTGSVKGVATTPSISFTGDATLTFKAGAWNSSSEKTTLYISASSGTLKRNGNTINSVTMTRGAWTTYTVDIVGVASSVKITFEGAQASNSRFFLDEIVVSQTVSTVAAPTFSPAAGTYTSAQNVTLSSATSGATIYYTTDGSSPTTSSSVYSSPISVSSTTTIKAFAVKSGMNNSTLATATYTINTSTQYAVTFIPGSGTCSTTTMSGSSGTSITLPTATPSSECAAMGWSFVGWASSSVNETNTAPTLLTGSYTINGNATLYAVYKADAGMGTQTTTFNFANIAAANDWVNGTQYKTVYISPITLNAFGGGNSGKYYTSDHTWRIYSSDHGGVMVSSDSGNITAVSSSPSRTFTITNGRASFTAESQSNFSSISVTYETTLYTYATSPICMENSTPRTTFL